MMFAKRVSFVCVAAVLCVAMVFHLTAMSASAQVRGTLGDQPVAAADLGECSMVIMQGGDMWVVSVARPGSGCDLSIGTWMNLGNVFNLSGRPMSPIVGMNNDAVLSANGDLFIVARNPFCNAVESVTFRNNAFDVSGMQAPGEEFISFGTGGGTTNHGNLYQGDRCRTWVRIGGTLGDQSIAAADLGQCSMVVTQSGDMWVVSVARPGSGCDLNIGTWMNLGNVFNLSGRPMSPIVGMNNDAVLSANGDLFIVAQNPYCTAVESVTFRNNAFEASGMQAPGEEFISFGSGGGITNHGNLYQGDRCRAWVSIGSYVPVEISKFTID